MKTEEMMEFFMNKYPGEFNQDFAKEVDEGYAVDHVICDEYIGDLKHLLGNLEQCIDMHFKNRRLKKNTNAEECLLDANYVAHELVHTALSIWTQLEGMLPDES